MKKKNFIKKLIFSLFLFIGLWSNALYAVDFYWENPVSLTNTDSRFPVSVSNGKDNYIIWQEVNTSKKEVSLCIKNIYGIENYSETRNIAGPFIYSGDDVPDIFTAAILDDGTLAVAAITGISSISVFTSTDQGKTFTEVNLKTSGLMVAPRIYKTNANTFKLFTSLGDTDSFTIYTCDSKDGINWQKMELFEPASQLRNPFIPVLVPFGSGDMVVFQAQLTSPETGRYTYQLYQTFRNSANGVWSPAALITNEKSLSGKATRQYYNYQNQRPALFNDNGKIYVAWERSETVNSSLWVAEVTYGGIVSGTSEALSSSGSASRPAFFKYNDNVSVTWFDTRRGKESVYMAVKEGSYWNDEALVEDSNSNLFVNPLVLPDSETPEQKVLAFVWQQITSRKKNNIAMLYPDKSVAPPSFTTLSYKKGRKANQKNVQIQINYPADSSGIKALSYIWTRDKNEQSPKMAEYIVNPGQKSRKVNVKADGEDGPYYLIARVQDYADNWSECSLVEYTLDTTPPSPPQINFDSCDNLGILKNNNFKLSWNKPAENDVDGYIYKFEYVFDIPKNLSDSKRHPCKLTDEEKQEVVEKLKARFERNVKLKKIGTKLQTKDTETKRFYNYSNGVYALYVAAVDDVGNVGETSVGMFIMNKYEPSTWISSVELHHDELGGEILTIHGGGFTYDGLISQIIIDRDGAEPYDLVLNRSNNGYKIQSNTLITNVKLGTELEEGDYRIILTHTDRGIYRTGKVFKLETRGVVKIESDYVTPSNYSTDFVRYKYKITIYVVLTVLILLIGCLTIFGIFNYLNRAVVDTTLSEIEIKSIVAGKLMPMKKIQNSVKRQPSLKSKLILFTFLIIIVSVLIVAIQNGYRSVNLQKQTMAEGLENRTEVLLESLHSGVKNFLPANNILELSALPEQKEAMPEVKYVTIVGQKSDALTSDELDIIWATNDLNIGDKTDSYTITYGESKITDAKVLEICKKIGMLDKEIPDDIKELASEIDRLTKQANQAYSTLNNDELDSVEYLTTTVADLRNKLDVRLGEISKLYSGSLPGFNSASLDMGNTDYIFYRPVLYRKGNTGNYVHAIIFIELSTQTLIDSVRSETIVIVQSVLIVAVIAIVLGIIAAYIFAALIIRPIKKLEHHLMMIGRTKNKAELKDKDIEIKSKDEIGRLGNAVNSMTHELVKVAEEEKLTLDGKAVQNAFLPLIEKSTVAEYNDQKIECFGYYEGESGVSGDYFDYRKLDDEWYVAIKCDASGHGVPAAIIMTVVATLFREYFNSWTFKKNGTQLNKLVEQVNDSIESLGLKGKFATMIICLLNQKSGDLYMCNAGDTLVHVYDSAEHKIKVLTLATAPTAGVFSSDLIAMRGGFKVEKSVLKHGDILYLYTDGIEESTRRVRNENFEVKQEEVQVKKVDPKTHEEQIEVKLEDMKEEFGPERVQAIIEAVLNKQKYVLTKLDNPRLNEVLEFDFTTCEGTVKESILALASVEKVYRLYKPEGLTRAEYIKIDKKIDEFLSQHFNVYELYSRHKTENAETPNYFDYEHMYEDEQSDDLTMLALKRI